MKKKTPNKQHDARAASFKRLAKDIHKIDVANPELRDYSRKLAQKVEAEAKLLRSMR